VKDPERNCDPWRRDGVDIIAATAAPGGSKFIEIQVKATQGGRFWLLGAQNRSDIPQRASLFFVFVRPESTSSGFQAFVVPSADVRRKARQQENKKFQFCWYPPADAGIYRERWDSLG
jgi:hypothetical protein